MFHSCRVTSFLLICMTGCSEPAPAPPSPPAGSPAMVCPAPQHPFMATNGASNIHNDAYMTDTYDWAGPTSASASVVKKNLDGECATITVDAQGRLISICVSAAGAKRLVLLDPKTLDVLAAYEALPKGLSETMFGGGGYFYLDHQDKAIVTTVDGTIMQLSVNETAPKSFQVESTWDLKMGATGLVDTDGILESALPDWSGRIWFVTENGAVGFVDPKTNNVRIMRLTGESIGNSFAVDDSGGVFVVTDYALYRFDVDMQGQPIVTFREEYDRGTRQKPGQVMQGSGTTPTLFGDDWVAITDNADPYMHVLVYARGKAGMAPRKICEVPVFEENASATDNSLIGCGRSIVVENNYGYGDPFAVSADKTTSPGISRIDVRADGTGCDLVWTSSEAAPSVVPKLSVAANAVYTYVKKADGWYFSAVDFSTGKTRFEIPTGYDFGYNNHYAPVSLTKDGTAYVGLVFGLLAVQPQ